MHLLISLHPVLRVLRPIFELYGAARIPKCYNTIEAFVTLYGI